MPAYDYLQPDGSRMTRVLPVEDRDRFPGRITVPDRVNVPRGEPKEADVALRGYYEVEQKEGADAIRRCSMEFGGIDGIKKIWAK